MPGAAAAVARLRQARLATGVVSNQSGVAYGLITLEQVAAVNRRIDELLGSLAPWAICPHALLDACACRKPAPGLIFAAAAVLGLRPQQCVVVGDIGADIDAAAAAGARGILVPTPRTNFAEIRAAPHVVDSVAAAVGVVLQWAA